MSFNPTFDRALHGEGVKNGFEFSPNAKVSFDFTKKIAGGLEYYGSPWARSLASAHGPNSITNSFLASIWMSRPSGRLVSGWVTMPAIPAIA